MRVKLRHDQLVEIMSRSKLTQNHWAMKLGLSRGHLSDLVNGKHPYPSPKTRDKLLVGTGIPFDELFVVETGASWFAGSEADFKAELAEQYMIDEELGQGGMGTVYLARDIKHGRQVAVKVISPEAVSGVGANQFLKEIRYAARLQHPHVLPLLDSGIAAGFPYYVMPRVRDGSLRQRLARQGRLSLDQSLGIVRGVASALERAHGDRIVHCDVKPENILLDGDHAYLADFGVSRAVHAEVRAWGKPDGLDSSAGTPAYVSPEQASGDPDIDARSDVYSLGCVVYEMLSGIKAFGGINTMEVVSKRFVGEVPELRHVDPTIPLAVSAAVRNAMALDARRRFASARAFLEAFEHACATRHPVMETVALVWSRLASLARRAVGVPPSSQRRGSRIVANIAQDLAYTFRSFRRRPGQTAVLLCTLAIGIGLNSAMFSIVSTVLLRSLPYPDPDQLVVLWESRRGQPREIAVAYPNFVDMRDRAERFSAISAYFGGSQPVTGGDRPVRAPAYYVSERFFDVLGVTPLIGTIGSADRVSGFFPGESPGAGVTAVVSHAFWRSALGADSAAIGQTLMISGRPAVITGVMPPDFSYPQNAALWSPIDMSAAFGPSRTAHNLTVVGRLAGGASLQTGQTEMSALAGRLSSGYPDEVDQDFDINVVPLHEQLAGDSRRTLILLFSVVGVVLLIACANMASILLSQAIARNKEMAIRRAIGADSRRLMAQTLTESASIGLAGAVIGLALAAFSTRILNVIVPAEYLHSGRISLDVRVVLFTLVLGLVTGILFGLAPALRAARQQPVGALRGEGTNLRVGGRRRRLGGLFVIPQYAFSLMALITAGLILKSLFNLGAVDPGFAAQGLVTVDLSLPFSPPSPYAERSRVVEFHRQLIDRMGQLPGVRSVTMDLAPPFAGTFRVNGGARPEGTAEDEWPTYPDWRVVDADYFRTIGLPLLAGREFTDQDDQDAIPVVIANQTLAQQLWGMQDPMGRRLQLSSLDNNEEEANRWLTVVGVAADVRTRGLDEEPRAAAYAPRLQHLDRARGMDLIIALDGASAAITPAIRNIVEELDPELPLGRIETIEGWIDESTSAPRFRAGLLSVFGGIAVALALLGMYGVMSYSVSQRHREVAVRSALGATSPAIVRMLTIEGLAFVIGGQLIGTLGALALSRLVEGLLFGVSATDVVVYATVSPLLAAVVLLTAWIPARRAGRVEPTAVLR
jgi:putative ABC transport system permease protein